MLTSTDQGPAAANANVNEIKFDTCHIEWACSIGFDLDSAAGVALKAIITSWPEQHKPDISSRDSFARSCKMVQILADQGLFAADLTDPKRKAYLKLTEEVIASLKSGGLKPFEVNTVVAAIGSLAPSEVPPPAKKRKGEVTPPAFGVLTSVAPNSGQQRVRVKDWVVALINQEFGADIKMAKSHTVLDLHPVSPMRQKHAHRA
jgi:hypothetical protein